MKFLFDMTGEQWECVCGVEEANDIFLNWESKWSRERILQKNIIYTARYNLLLCNLQSLVSLEKLENAWELLSNVYVSEFFVDFETRMMRRLMQMIKW